MKPKLLYLVHRIPFPPNRGDRIRSYHLLRFLAQRHDVYLATLADEPVAPATREALEGLCTAVAVAPLNRRRWWQALTHFARGRTATEGLFYSRALHRAVRNWTATLEFDAALVFCSSMMPYAEVARQRGIPLVVDLVDVDSQKWFDYAAKTKMPIGWAFAWEGRRLRALESSLPAQARAVTLVSDLEARLYQRFCPNSRTHAVINGVDLDYFSPAASITPAKPGHDVVFLGALDYRANVDGLLWFCREVWPGVRREAPAATFAMVGRNPASALRKLAGVDGVELVGGVPDVRPHLVAAKLTVAPLRIARGIQNKVLESMAVAKPVVVSPEAMEGLQVEPGTHLALAGTPREWVEQITLLLRDAQRRQQLGVQARTYVERHHAWDACLAPFEALLRSDSSSPTSPAGGK